MISNVPEADELREISLRLYFKAWSDVVGILLDWLHIMNANVPSWGDHTEAYELSEEDLYSEEWLEYLEKAQGDLQAVYALIQQSQEIGLKAKICGVSPFLLLRRPDQRPEPVSPGVYDFTDFSTIDAQSLPRTHDTFLEPLSSEFVQLFESLRRSRNKISHLGIHRDQIAPHRIISILQIQFSALYPDRNWFQERVRTLSSHRFSEMAELSDLAFMHSELGDVLPVLSPSQFAWLMGSPPAVPRFLCRPCEETGKIQNADVAQVATAYRDRDKVHCVLCHCDTPVKDGKCWDPSCSGTLQSDQVGQEPYCLVCGASEQDIREYFSRDEQPAKMRFVMPQRILEM